MTTEIWKDIPGFEGRYQASDQGRVRSVDNYVRCGRGGKGLRLVRGRVLRPGNSRGYLIVNLPPAGTIAVHLLVARAFLSPRPAGAEVNHKDGVKVNCAPANLEWVTKTENQLHAVAFGLKTQALPVVSPSGVHYPSIAQAAKNERVAHRTARAWRRA